MASSISRLIFSGRRGASLGAPSALRRAFTEAVARGSAPLSYSSSGPASPQTHSAEAPDRAPAPPRRSGESLEMSAFFSSFSGTQEFNKITVIPSSPPPSCESHEMAALGVDAEVVAIPSPDDEAAGAAPAHGGGDNAVLIDDGDGADASPLAADSDGENSAAAADGKRKRKMGRPRKTPVPPLVSDVGKRKMGRPRKTPVPPPVSDVGKRKVGRPRKTPVPPPVSDVGKRKMGRPRKTPVPVPPPVSDVGKRKMGRPRKTPVPPPVSDVGKRKMGRPKKSAGVAVETKKKGKEEEEAVSSRPFDGGDHVICDKRGCTKVYHPACVNGDEADFRTRGRWNCGVYGGYLLKNKAKVGDYVQNWVMTAGNKFYKCFYVHIPADSADVLQFIHKLPNVMKEINTALESSHVTAKNSGKCTFDALEEYPCIKIVIECDMKKSDGASKRDLDHTIQILAFKLFFEDGFRFGRRSLETEGTSKASSELIGTSDVAVKAEAS